jgi:glycerol uptake facilitator-like aquaporin
MKDKLKKLKLDDYSPDLGGMKALAAEALGTFGLVLAAAGISSSFGAVAAVAGGVQGALAPGFALFTLVLLFGPVSGASFNPAVTLGLVLAGRLPKGRLVPYIVAECAGALAAGLVLRILLRSTVIGITTTQMPGLAAVLLEALATGWLTFAILVVTEKDLPLIAVAGGIGGTLTVLALWVGPLTGGSFNPARSLGPALASLDFSDLWIYLVGPFLGGAAGASVYKWFHGLR